MLAKVPRLQRCYDCKGVARLASFDDCRGVARLARCGIRVCDMNNFPCGSKAFFLSKIRRS